MRNKVQETSLSKNNTTLYFMPSGMNIQKNYSSTFLFLPEICTELYLFTYLRLVLNRTVTLMY
jgi:hypothetical protein